MANTSPSGMPVVHGGIELVSVKHLPDRLSGIFDFHFFNAIQSKCFNSVYQNDDNFVLSAPTGSGKTAIFELAICRLFSKQYPPSGQAGFKVVYQAPTKALCSERQKDWQKKFSYLGLRCEELTGDSDPSKLHHVENADIIVTTPEKWDSITRKWKDRKKTMDSIRLFLIDEVHILKEDRGASLEAIVSRMKFVGSAVRFIALSATVPNAEDIATWLGKNPTQQSLPALKEVFDDDLRPVRLQKHVYGCASDCNDFQFEGILNQRLPDVIQTHSKRKPIMIFCSTRKSSEETANTLVSWWQNLPVQGQCWPGITLPVNVGEQALRSFMKCGVAYHHAGLELKDRVEVEKLYLAEGGISVICCTSTLAVGVNLPCHFIVIKNTVSWSNTDMTLREYSDLDLMQMLGRAGRPQFDSDAVAVIMTRQEKVSRYEQMNAEVGLGTIYDVETAQTWLKGTFLFVRLRANPQHYKLQGDTPNLSLQQRALQICQEGLNELQTYRAIQSGRIRPTEIGEAMARHFVSFGTLKKIVGLPPRAKISEILSAIAQASEFDQIRFRGAEKAMLKDINSSPMTKYPIKVDLSQAAQKVSLIIQSELGGNEVPNEERFRSLQKQYRIDANYIFKHVHRVARCIVDCEIALQDSVAARNALELARSLHARIWDDSPRQMSQVEGIGPVSVRRLVGSDIRTMEDFENADPHRVNMILSKNPPFAQKMISRLQREFPKLRVELKKMGQPEHRRDQSGVFMNIKADVGFVNEAPPGNYRRKPVQVWMMAETSDGQIAHVYRTSGQKLGRGQEVLFVAHLTSPHQMINCYVACDNLVGTFRSASLNPRVPQSILDEGNKAKQPLQEVGPGSLKRNAPGSARSQNATGSAKKRLVSEEFEDFDIPDEDMADAADAMADFVDIDEVSGTSPIRSRNQVAVKGKQRAPAQLQPKPEVPQWSPVRLPNGNWECHHPCKDKTSCRHLCCREGATKKPKPRNSESQEPNPNKMTAYLEETTMNVPNTFLSPHKKGQGFFVSDSSSPVKADDVPTVDLSSDPAGSQRPSTPTLAANALAPSASHDESREHEREVDQDGPKERVDEDAGGEDAGAEAALEEAEEEEKDELAAWLKSAFGDYVELV
ncbi:MAG: Sec63 [Alyxoria varia]|nr:MAG: Sec63 [Alyxoria varia]